MPTSIPILLDTDPGNDIDDALAIAYLLKQPRCRLIGITTVTGNVAKRAALADAVCRSVGRTDVPIFAGRDKVLAYGPGQPNVPQYEAIEAKPHRIDYAENCAVDFLRKTIRENPGEIVLASIGPFQNIALLFALDPEIPRLLRGFVSMAGAFFGHNHSEWNCIVDPVATAMVAQSARPHHLWYGLDVTTQVTQTSEVVRATYLTEPLTTILPMAEIWFRHTPNIVYHDPLAVASIFEPTLCQYRRGTVTVDPSNGKTSFEEGDGPDEVASVVEVSEFFDHFFGIVNGNA